HVAYGNTSFPRRFEVDGIDADADLLYQAQLPGFCDVGGGKRPQKVPDDVRLRQQGVKPDIIRFGATFDVQAPIDKRSDLPAPGGPRIVVQEDFHRFHGKASLGGSAPRPPEASATRKPSFHFANRSERVNDPTFNKGAPQPAAR